MRIRSRSRRFFLFAFAWAAASVSSGCMTAYKQSVGAHTQESFTRVYPADFNVAWQSVLDALKSVRLDVSNRESGVIQTRWQDNTSEKNSTDGDGATLVYMKAQYRFRLSLAKGFFSGRPAVKVTVLKEQLVQRDALDDFHPLPTDSIEENTLLYRIGRIITIRDKLTKLEEDRTNLEMRQFRPGP